MSTNHTAGGAPSDEQIELHADWVQERKGYETAYGFTATQIRALFAALALSEPREQVQNEPVAWTNPSDLQKLKRGFGVVVSPTSVMHPDGEIPLYATPQPTVAEHARNWQPIATAPKDTSLWLYAASLRDHDFCPAGTVDGHWQDDAGWMGAVWDGYRDQWDTRVIEPTHWMLPWSPALSQSTPAPAQGLSDALQMVKDAWIHYGGMALTDKQRAALKNVDAILTATRAAPGREG